MEALLRSDELPVISEIEAGPFRPAVENGLKSRCAQDINRPYQGTDIL